MWNTPQNYRQFPGGKDLPEKLKVWRIQQISKDPGVLAMPSGMVAAPFQVVKGIDAEPLVEGYNTGKMNGAVAIGRHGNFLQWGFAAGPSQMTDAGRALFVNCVVYIVKFDGKAPPERK
jgi:hypothetical protein